MLAAVDAKKTMVTDSGSAHRRSEKSELLATLTIQNTGSSTAKGHFTHLYLLPFKDGDVFGGTWPKFQLTNGTAVAVTFLDAMAVYWTSGCLKSVPAFFRTPDAPNGIDSGSSISVQMFSGGSLPAASSRSTKDFSAGNFAPQVQYTGLDHLDASNGDWTASLTAGISDNLEVKLLGNGSAGAVWKVLSNARQNNTRAHGQLVGQWYCASLENSDGSFNSMRFVCYTMLPYYDSSATKNWMTFSRFQLYKNNSTILRDLWKGNGQTSAECTWSGAGPLWNCASHGLQGGFAVRVSASGRGPAVPANMSATTTYFASVPGPNKFAFATKSQVNGNGVAPNQGSCPGQITPSDGGSGTLSVTSYPLLPYYGALSSAETNGQWSWMQGSGNGSAESTVRMQIDPVYWKASKVFPPYDLSVRPSSSRSETYFPGSWGPVTRCTEESGDRFDIGLAHSWFARWFLTQAAVDEQVVRVVGHVGAQLSINVKNSSTLTVPVVNNGHDGSDYSGMPAKNSAFFWNAHTNSTPSTVNPADSNVYRAGYDQNQWSHMPAMALCAYWMTGSPEYFDTLVHAAINAVCSRNNTAPSIATIDTSNFKLGTSGAGTRNVTIGRTTYYGHVFGDIGSNRLDAWALRDIVGAAAFCPTGRVEYQYLQDLADVTPAMNVGLINALPPYAKTNGLWVIEGPDTAGFQYAPWQAGYYHLALAMAAALREDANAKTALTSALKWPAHVLKISSGWCIASSYQTVRKTATAGAAIIDDDSQWAASGGGNGLIVTWDSSTPTLTIGAFYGYRPTDGDRVMWTPSSTAASFVSRTPSGFSNFKPYYLINCSGATCQITSVKGDARNIVQPGDSGTSGCMQVSPTAAPATGAMSDTSTPGGILFNVYAGCQWAIVAGSTVDTELTNDLRRRVVASGQTFVSDPKWALMT
jgi:hypothetical protein